MKKIQELFNSTRTGLFGGRARKPSPVALAAQAGRTGRIDGAHESALMEPLEKREYLFVLTVDQNDPTFQADPNRPHYGTVLINFSYFLPFLRSQLPQIGVNQPPAEPPVDATWPGPGRNVAGGYVARNRMSAWLEQRMMGVQLSLYGRFEDDPNTPQVELPTQIQVFDLYGRDMQGRLDIGRESPLLGLLNVGGGRNQINPDTLEAIGDRGTLTGAVRNFAAGGQPTNVGNGVPDMNDGLGMIVMIQSDALTRLNMVGGQTIRVTNASDLNNLDVFDPNSFYGIDIPDNAGAGELWQGQGLGFDIIPGQTPVISGLPEIAGSIVFGAPFIRDNTDSLSYFNVDNNQVHPQVDSSRAALPNELNFTSLPLSVAGPLTIDGVTINTPIMGIRTLRPDQNAGEINVPGLVMGTVDVSGSLGLFYAQHMFGSMNVTGDMGQLYVGGTMGYWVREDQRGSANALDNLRATGSIISVGGRLGQVFVAGRNRASIFVTGDTTNPRARIEGSTYNEVETVFGINPATDVEALAGALNGGTIRAGNGTYRNDGFATAEFISSGLSGTSINGSLGLMDPLNDEDLADFYAFAADAGRTVQFNVIFPNPFAAQNAGQAYVRVFDANGNLVATHQGQGATPADTTNPTQPRTGVNFQFAVPETGLYYLVVGTAGDGQFNTSLQYTVTMAGQAATTLGQVLTGGGLTGSSISVSQGAVGRISGGLGVIGGDGAPLRAESDASGIPNADYVDSAGFSISVPTLYNILFGGDVGGGVINASGAIGSVQVLGGVMSINLTAGRTLGSFDVGGQTGVQEVGNLSRNAGQTGGSQASVFIRTGAAGVPGHIGRLGFGDLVRGDQFTLTTSAGSFVDLLQVQQGGFTQSQPQFNMGQGSDIRFASFPSVRLANPGQQDIDYFLPLLANTPLTLTDDSGVTFTVTVTGTGSFGTMRVTPAGQLGGVIVGRIDVTLGARGNLNIATTSSGSLALGEVNITGGGNGPGQTSNVTFSGPAEIDVRLLSINGAVGSLVNSTPDGDIVSADIGAVNTITVNGSIGATRTYVLSNANVAQRINIGQGLSNAPNTPVGIPAAHINAWQGGVFVPAVWPDAQAQDRTLEDSGSPIDDVLNGVVIRTGNVQSITARGSIGDVITQGGNGGAGDGGRVNSIVANSDRANTTGRFEGIAGSIFVGQVQVLDVGDGVLGPGSTPFAQAGVFAIDDIISVVAGTRVRNPVLTGALFIAGNANAAQNDDAQGIGSIRIVGANLDRAFVHVANLDSWWRSVRYGTDRVAPSGVIQSVSVTGGSIIGTDLHALAIGTISVTGGVWDSSSAQVDLSIGTINADAFTSSLSTRDPLQYMFNQIRAGLDVGTVRVNNPATGDIEDLFISAGRNNTTISARNIVRSNVDIRGNAGTMTFRGDVRASSIGSGRLASMNVSGDIRSSTITISGAILNLTAGGDITDTEITSTGPDGRINNLTASGTITGVITSSGPIGTIRTTRGDINATLVTTDSTDGNINSVQAGRDLILVLDMADGTTVNTLRAARNIGRRLVDGATPDALEVPGNISTITAGGVLYSDVRAGGSIGTVTSGRALAYLPTADFVTDAVITASGRITAVNINGDFNGSVISYSGGIGGVTITNGSFRAGDDQRPNRIEARDGDITSVRIVRGHLLGDVLAPQGSINTLSVTGDGVFGNIGVSPDLSAATQSGVALSERRTQLPVGAALTAGRDGPTIAAGVNIGTITVGGGIFEAVITAGRQIGAVTVTRGIDNAAAGAPTQGTVIAAGDRVGSLTVQQQARGTFVAAGLTGLGDDGEVGGTGADADTVKNGSVGTLNFRGGTASVTVGAGLVAGADGLYNTADDQSAPGISTVASVQVVGTATNTVVRTDSGTPLVSTNLNGGSNAVGGQSLPVADGFAYAGATPGGVAVTSTGLIVTIGGQLRRLTFTGAGTATYSAGLNLGSGAGTLVLAGTTTASTLRIDAAPAGAVPVGTLRTVVGRDDASLGALNAANTDLTNLSVVLDGSINTVTARNLTNSPVRTGQSLGNVTAGAANSNTGLVVESRGTIGSVRTLGGVTNAGGVPASVQGLNIGTVSLAGQLNGLVSSDRDITSLTVNGPLTNGSGVRAGYNLGNTVVGSMSTATLSAGGNVGTVRVNGNATDSAILSGVDLGRDANFGGAGVNADTVTNGNMGAVTISGNFVRSDISAGGYQGADGFLGTQDDLLGEGRSTLGNVTVNGVAQGSLLNTESYRVFTNGTRGTVRAQGLPLTSTQNLAVVGQQAKPDALQVTGVNVQFIGGVYFATIGFNQPVDPSTIAAALSISEVRGAEPIATSIDLVQGADYTVTYSAGSTSALIQFSPAVTNRDLELDANNGATQSAAAGPGIFRFTIDSSAVRGQTSATRLDGDRDGVAEASDNWTSDFVIGDAGDRIQATHGLTANLDGVDFYGPANLDVVMGNTTTPDSPAANQLFNIQGVLGDHPDTNATFFGAGSDVDIYTVTLQQGQILDMGITQGGAQTTLLQLDAGGQLQNANVQGLADGRSLVLETGTYVIAVTSVAIDPFMAPGALTQPVVLQGPGADPNDLTGDVINIPNNGATGPYTLSVRIVDDGDNGFDGPTDASDGSNIENAPLPSAFSGGDGILGTQDDLAAITVGQYVYRLDAGANGAVNGNGAVNRRSDDMVIGVNQYGTEQVRTAGADGVFGTSDDLAAVNGSIGERNAVGGALVTANDVDIYRLNGGQPIVAGQRYRFTLRVSDYGGDLGTPHSPRPTPGGGVGVAGDDGRGQAQFALFELNGNGQNGGSLVAQAPNPEGFRARPNTVVATDGGTTYGYDANGDFYMELTVPPSQADANQDGRFALYVQGIHQSNYTVEIVNVGAGSTPTAQYQNFLIETNGGVVNWLNAFGGPSVLDRYTGSVAANVPGLGAATRAYILTQLVNNLNNIFAAAGVDARISLNSADFVGEAFSTVFVTDSLEPADYINQNFFGVSERRDVLNANRSDQAVVFAPALTALGNTVDQAGIDSYITSLTGSVVQRMGELLGLTFAEFDTGGAMVDGIPGAVNANALTPADLQFNSTESNLQQNLRSSFILGQQNDTQLLRRIFQLNT